MAIKHVVVRDLLNTRLVLYRHTATGNVDIRYTETGEGKPMDRFLAINPDLDRGDGAIISPEFNTVKAVRDFQASLTSVAA